MNTDSIARPRHEVSRDIRRFLARATQLPGPQGTSLRLIELAQDPTAGLGEIVAVIRSDPALAAFVLRAAATARYRPLRGTLSLEIAVQRLGLCAIRVHALVLSLIPQCERMRCEGFNYHRFWITSMHTALLAEALAERIVKRAADDGFTLGLLAGVGRLAFATAEPDEYGRLLAFARKSGTDIETLERETFGFDHAEFSAVLFTDWTLPTSMADIIYWQRDPEGGGFTPGSTQALLAGCLCLARVLAERLCTDDADGTLRAIARRRAATLGIGPDELQRVFETSMLPLR
ncbi:MAG: HDOD domain-containing protein, partial [Azoarcus sp.]|nr:HDOD domain-containing protein [Azoarcus sp.]